MEYWDRDTGDRDVGGPGQGHRRQRITGAPGPGQKGTRIRTRIWVAGIRTETKGKGYWDLDRERLGTGQRCGRIGIVT